MSPDGHVRRDDRGELQGEPEQNRNEGRQIYRQGDRKRDEGEHTSEGKENQKSTDHSGYRAGCADCRVDGVEIEEYVTRLCRGARGAIEDEVADMTEAVFDVVSDDQQDQHVSEKVG